MTSSFMRTLAPLFAGTILLVAALSAPAYSEELRVGFLAPRTGIFTAIGTDMLNGFQMYLDEHNGMLGGATVKLIVEDTQGKPDTAVAKAKKLILQDKVHMLVGGLLASTAYALGPVSTSEKTLYIGSSATADDLAQRQVDKYPYVAFSTWLPSLPNHPLGQWACDQGYKDRRRRRRLRLRLRADRRLPADLRGLRRQDHPEGLGAARHQGLRAIHSRPSKATPTPSSR